MQLESIPQQEPESDSPGSSVNVSTSLSTNGQPQSNGKAGSVQDGTSTTQFPPPKTDKPRPHVCTTCGRSFARLEHLKRHERSHTKEKPFECPECTRCFARRDLLLRHQQKLHMTNATTRPRQGRRESVGGASVAGGGRVRKNSVANVNIGGTGGNLAQGRPRANTISHVDMGPLGLFDASNPDVDRMTALGFGLGNHTGLGSLHGPGNFDYRGMSHAHANVMGHHVNVHGLPKLDTHVNNLDMSNSLRTAPPHVNFGGFDIDQLFTPHTTINPAALHFGSAGSIPSSNIPFGFDASSNQQVPVDDDFGWMRNWNMHLSSGVNDNEQAIDESSPSRMSSGDSPEDYAESMTHSQAGVPVQQNNHFQWPHHDMQSQQNVGNGTFQLEALGTGLPSLEGANGTVSPSSLHDPTPTRDTYFHQAMMQQQNEQHQQLQLQHQHQHQHQQHQHHQHHQPQHHQHQNHHHQHQPQQPQQSQQPLQQQQQHQHQSQPDAMQSQNGSYFGNPISNFGSDSPSIASSSMTSSARQSSVTSMSTDSITDSTRQALLNSLSQPSVFSLNSQRKFSQPNVSSPLSPGAARGSSLNQGPTLPSTADIRRYIEAFMQYAHPHLPLTHLPTVSFNTEQIVAPRGTSPSGSASQNPGKGGARCLILGMAAIGALYEYEHLASKDLFEAAKKMISLYLEERRKADISAAANGSATSSETPLWLVQAMLLTVIYGHHCGDRLSADIASNHVAALVSLARAANLAKPPVSRVPSAEPNQPNGDVDMADAGEERDLQSQWMKWKTDEERKRCLFSIFFMSSLLTTAYNQTPTIMNSEILLDLPCSEELFDAETAEDWQKLGGLAASDATSLSFATALSTLLTANQRQGNNFTPSVYNSSSAAKVMPSGEEELRPSTFGCLILISALHNYIWETRSRHRLREWTMQETESMVAHLEPALNAWQAAWKANQHHKLERPNPFGLGPLSADSIPLLDLAFVRLYVNLGTTAEAFWRRDFDAMAEELAIETVASPDSSKERKASTAGSVHNSPAQSNGIAHRRPSQLQGGDAASTRRERHLRKAAFYAADSLTIACSYNLTYADSTAHELPINSAICFFDCTQVLAEWCTTVQERVGRYLGVLGRDPIDYSQVPAIMLLETEDVELLRKIDQICQNMEDKRLQQENLLAMEMSHFNNNAAVNSMANGVNLNTCGIGSKVLRVVAMMLEKAVIWPIIHVMAKALETEALHMDRRAEASRVQ